MQTITDRDTLDRPQDATAAGPASAGRSRTGWLIAAAVGLLVAIGSAVGIAATAGGDAKPKAPTSTPYYTSDVPQIPFVVTGPPSAGGGWGSLDG